MAIKVEEDFNLTKAEEKNFYLMSIKSCTSVLFFIAPNYAFSTDQ